MKKYLNLLFVFTLVFSLAFSSLTNPIQKVESASTTSCTSPVGFDRVLNLPCSVLQIPCPASGVYSNGEKCRLVQLGNTNVSTLTLSSSARAKKGTVSLATKTIQAILASLGFLDKNGVDGKFGKNTELAVKAYQKSRGLYPDGKVGKNTVAQLQESIKLLKKFSTGGGTGADQKVADFIKNAEKSINMNDSTTFGTLISSEPGTNTYERNFGLVPGAESEGPVVFHIHTHN